MLTLCDDQLETLDTTEVHWSTGTILAVFFAASLISAVFFGLGYSFGGAGSSKSALAITLGAAATQSPTSPQSSRAASSNATLTVPQATASVSEASQTSSPVRHATVALHSLPARLAVHPTAGSAVKRVTPPASLQPTAVASRTNESPFMVQVGAIGDRKDANRLVAQLRKKGFHAGIYPGKHDRFLHVQIGPYKNEQQAQSMQHHLAASGYHSILKRSS